MRTFWVIIYMITCVDTKFNIVEHKTQQVQFLNSLRFIHVHGALIRHIFFSWLPPFPQATLEKVLSTTDDDTSAQIDTQLSTISTSIASEPAKPKSDKLKKKSVLFEKVHDTISDDDWTEMSEMSITDMKENSPLHKYDQTVDSSLSK